MKITAEPGKSQSTDNSGIPLNDDSYNIKKKKKKRRSKFKVQDSEISSTSEVKEERPDQIEQIKSEEKESSTSSTWNSPYRTLWLTYRPRFTTLIKAGADWVGQLIDEEPNAPPVDGDTKKKLKELAEKILQNDVENYKKREKQNARHSESNFRKTIYNMGTSRDKMAAHVLRCMESPAHSLHHLDAVIQMVSPKAKNEYDEAIDSVLKLLSSTFLPENKIARKFEDHQFSSLLPILATSREQVEKQLALWYFEDQLYFAFRKLISQLKLLARDSVDKSKNASVKSMITLVKNHPGQDTEMILEAVVNKLGDPSRKVASHTMYWLHHLVQRRQAMKIRVVNIVEILLFRPNISLKTQYFCLCYLKDMIFKYIDQQLAGKMIKLYIGFFKACTKKGEVDTRMMGALLRGINRAFPFSRLQGNALQEQLETLYKLCHIVSFAIATQALQLIYHITSAKNEIQDRFYQVLYKQMLDSSFGSSTGTMAFLNLIFKAMMRDDSLERRQAFIKRLLQVAQYQSPHLMCGILFLISEIIKEKPDLRTAVQTSLQLVPDLKDENDDFEVFEDADDDMDEVEKEKLKKEVEESKQETSSGASITKHMPLPASSSWFHCTNASMTSFIKAKAYDPYNRNPQYCGAQFSSLWEMSVLQDHFHPSVCVFADKILNKENIDYSGDPLEDFAFMRFLDRFVYKNPKKDVKNEGTFGSTFGSRKMYCPEGVRGLAVNSDSFINLKSEEIPEDQKFFHLYFNKFYMDTKKINDDDDDDNESVGDDEFEKCLEKLHGVTNDESDIDEDIDFASGATGPSKGNRKGKEDDLEESDEEGGASEDEEPDFVGDEEGGASEDEEPDFGGDSGDDAEFDDEDAEDLDVDDNEEDMEFDEENVAFSDEDDNFGLISLEKKGKSKKKKQSTSDDLDSMFASADDFAHLLEENEDEDAGVPTITSKALSNKDRASSKQLNWEIDRNDKFQERGRYGKQGSWKRGQNKRLRGSGGSKRSFQNSRDGSHKKFGSTRGRGSFKAKRGGKRR